MLSHKKWGDAVSYVCDYDGEISWDIQNVPILKDINSGL